MTAAPRLLMSQEQMARLYNLVPHFDFTAVGPLGGRCSVGWIIQPSAEEAMRVFYQRLAEFDEARGIEHEPDQWLVVEGYQYNCN